MICRLCIKHSNSFVNIFDENGMQLGISDILGRHFWFKPHPDDKSTVICSNCWLRVNDFHEFYVTVETRHATLSVDDVKKEQFTEVIANEFIDPDVGIKEEFAEVSCFSDKATSDSESEQLNPFCELDTENVAKGEDIQISGATHTKEGIEDKTVSSCTVQKKRKSMETKKTANRKPKVLARVRSEKFDTREEIKEKSGIKTSREDYEMVRQYIQMSCELCTFISEDYVSLRKHFRIQHPKIKSYVRCCNKKLFHPHEIVQHAYKHFDPEFFKCKDCQKVFSEQTTLSRHMISAHAPEEEMNFHCDQCPKRFSRQKKLELHRNKHVPMNERTFICDQCPNSRFANNDLLKIHICMRHRRATNVCYVCAKEIRDKASFENHVRSHSAEGGPKVKCTVEGCDHWLKDEFNLQRHIRRLHTKEDKMVACDICGRECKNQCALSKHKRRVHSNIVFTCGVCKKTFKRAIYLREHMAQHTGEILYKCPFCTRTFNSNANMHAHKKKIHPIEWDNWRKTNNGSSQRFMEQKSLQNQ
ncbi:transcription factor grauzone-like [Rhagoletis pomonella]|uniref:transcription factor grauzone-like n=1 Tax=Rhagoletis pomonella TaxID=28610 RepID=UPI001782672A|nr:transcription factor grauzone-like [Rhagoletis pomonella]XP_036331093.1 transcription factor grauzone-like [Rhagoletis pomonella]